MTIAPPDPVNPDPISALPLPVEDAPQPQLARSTGILALGNVGSRVLGLLREMVIATLFGASDAVSAYRIAAQVPNLVYDMLVGGMLSAALVPVLSAQTREARKQLFAVLLGIFGVVLAVLALALFAAAPAIASLLAVGFRDDPALFRLTTQLIRLMAPAVWFFSMAGLLTAVLYSLQRFSFPAIGSAIFNLGVVLVTPLLASRIGIYAAALGVLAGSILQAAIMLWDVRRAGLVVLPHWNWRHPALRQILRLYLPVALGLLVMLFQVALDRRLASTTGDQSIAWMAVATTLQQMPLGLISVAVALASLPSLSRFFAAQDTAAFRATLGKGMRFVLLLIVPAGVGLALLATPITRLLFQRGAFTAADTAAVVAALQIYLVGMLFASIDFPLNYAFYARNNTLLPALVGVLSVVVYVIVAYALLQPMGWLGLVWADTAKQAAHALVMIVLLWRVLGSAGAGTVRQALCVALAGAAMALVLWLLDGWLQQRAVAGFVSDLLRVVAGGGVALIAYVTVLRLLRVNEVESVWRRVRGGV